MISLSGPSNRMKAGASRAATFSLGELGSSRKIALTVAALGASRNNESSKNEDSKKDAKHENGRVTYRQSSRLS